MQDHSPPLSPEAALDLILALPAHRSSNERHSKFGAVLVDEYFTRLREQYTHDNTAYGYLTELMATVAAAVRAFSVTRDIFGTRWSALVAVRDQKLAEAEQIRSYSPLHGDSIWGRIWSVLTSLGGTGVLGYRSQLRLERSPWWLWGAIFVVVLPISLILFHLVLNGLANLKCRNAQSSLPEKIDETWRERTLQDYRETLRHFLVNAAKLHVKWYPEVDLGYDPSDAKEINEIIEQHMTFC